MSAFDIAGAVVASVLSAIFWRAVFLRGEEWAPSDALGGFVFATSFSLWAVFCIARLFGAHL